MPGARHRQSISKIPEFRRERLSSMRMGLDHAPKLFDQSCFQFFDLCAEARKLNLVCSCVLGHAQSELLNLLR